MFGEYDGHIYFPAASVRQVAVEAVLLFLMLNAGFLLFGPGIERIVSKLRGKEVTVSAPLFCASLPLALLIAWIAMQIIVQPF